MKVSELTTEYIAGYLKIDEPEEEETKDIENFKTAAVSYVKSFTGLSAEEIDTHEDITIAVLVLISDMFDNRSLYLDYKTNVMNKTVEGILAMHSTNYL